MRSAFRDDLIVVLAMLFRMTVANCTGGVRKENIHEKNKIKDDLYNKNR